MLDQVVAAALPTLTGLGAWLAARREPSRLARVEAMVEDVLEWQLKHERRHVIVDGLGGMQ